MEDRIFTGLRGKHIAAGLLSLFVSYLTHVLLPVAIKDPLKRHEEKRVLRQKRDEFRAELARIHALVTKVLIARKYWNDTFYVLPDPPKRDEK